MKIHQSHYDIVVIGGGHAGIEAALASARLGKKTLLLTIHMDNIALMPCNPSVGGPAKGHIVREIDALGGQMGITADKTMLQIRTLNARKGPAVRALRAQSDKILYQMEMKKVLEDQENLYLQQGMAAELIIENKKLCGVKTQTGVEYYSKSVIITTGTSLRGLCHIGDASIPAGRIGEPPSNHFSDHLKSLGLKRGRLKTGTPPRILDSSIDFSAMEIEYGDTPSPCFSYLTEQGPERKAKCYLVHTTKRTKEIVEENLHRSPLYSGKIEGIGPRYCPSFEDKIRKFPDKETHLLYLEPESLYNHEIYIQGLSTSMPHDVQEQMVRSLPGLEKAHIMRPGYAVEYDFFYPIQLYPSLESKIIESLYFAGQINGTSGYEEAAGQGLIAGINAALKIDGKPPIQIHQGNSYIGVLIADLVTKNTEEPYRMFTSHVEHRTAIRHDNADLRLTELSYEVGLASQERMEKLQKKKNNILELQNLFKDYIATKEALNNEFPELNFQGKKSFYDLIKRPQFKAEQLFPLSSTFAAKYKTYPESHRMEAETEILYEGYIAKQNKSIEKIQELGNLKIPSNLDYDSIIGLSNEGKHKLKTIQPMDMQQASLISGVRKSDLALLVHNLKKNR
jgi:tRNA uridine 5-carboxymethylaminomethyl modification enzyme